MKIFILALILLLSFGALAAEELSFDPDLHRSVLQKNADRAATLEKVSRNPARFRGVQVFFSGRVEEIRERGKRRPHSYLYCSDGMDRFVCRVAGRSDRFSRGMIVECYGHVASFRHPFRVGDVPCIHALRVLTPAELAADALREKDLNLILAARAEGGLLPFARRRMNEGNWRDALFALSVALDHDRSMPRAVLLQARAETLLALGRPDEALADLHQCLALTPTGAQHQLLRGRIQLARGRYDLARRDLQAARRAGDTPQLWSLLVETEDRAGRPLAALELARQAREAGQATEAGLCRRAAYLAGMLGWPAEGVDWLQRLQKLQPAEENLAVEIRAMQRRVAMAEGESERRAQAREAEILERAARVLGREYVPLADVPVPEGLEEALEELCRRRVDDADPWQYRARIALLRRDGATARALLDEALRREKKRPALWWDAGWAAYYADRPDDARSLFLAARRLNPRMARAARAEEMIRTLTRLRAWDSPAARVRAHREYGNLLQTRGDHEDARFQYSEGLRFAPQDPDLLFHLGWLAWRRGDSVVAEDFFRRLFRDHPASHRHADHLRRLDFSAVELQALGYRPGAGR